MGWQSDKYPGHGHVSQGRIDRLCLAIDVAFGVYILGLLLSVAGLASVREGPQRDLMWLQFWIGFVVHSAVAVAVRGLAHLLVDWFVAWRVRGAATENKE